MHIAFLGSYHARTFGVPMHVKVHLVLCKNIFEDHFIPYITSDSWGMPEDVDFDGTLTRWDILEHLSYALRRMESSLALSKRASKMETIQVAFDYFDSTLKSIIDEMHHVSSSNGGRLNGQNLSDLHNAKMYISYWEPANFPKSDAALMQLLEDLAWSSLRNKKAASIQRAWRYVVSDPYHEVCKRRLFREFHDLPCLIA